MESITFRKFRVLILRKLLVLFLFLPIHSYTQEGKLDIVVMDLFGENATEKDLNDLTNALEKELVKIGEFNIIDRLKINQVLKEYGVQQKDCKTVPWIVRIGKRLNVDKVVTGSVINRGTVITVHVRTIDVNKKEIDKSATVVCRHCSIDVVFLKKMRYIALTLSGFEVSEETDDSLFYFSPGPLVTLDEDADRSNISTQIGDKLFEEYWQTKIKRTYGVGVLLFSLGTSFLLLNNIIWAVKDSPTKTGERAGAVLFEAGLAFASIPLFLRVDRLGKRLHLMGIDTAQEFIEKGFKLGVNISSFNPCTYQYVGESYQSKAGIILGGFLNLNLNKFISFQPEVLYILKGVKSEGEKGQDTLIHLNYFEIPLLFKGKLPLKGRLKPSIVIGLSPAFLTGGKRKIIKKDGELEKIDITKYITRFDLGLNYGFELGWKLKKGAIIFELRGIEGLIDIGDYYNMPSNQKNSSFSFILGYSF